MEASSATTGSLQRTGQAADVRAMSATNPLAIFWSTAIGKKVVMAVTGVIMVGFVLLHMLGNLKIFAGPDQINAYSRFLRTVGEPELGYGDALWIVRIVLLTCRDPSHHRGRATDPDELEGPAGRLPEPRKCRDLVGRAQRCDGAGCCSRFSSSFISFTSRWVRSGFEPGQYEDLHVYQNVVAGFSVWPVAVFYILAMAALCLHLDHGVWSMLQTLGWSNARNAADAESLSRVVAIVVFAGFISVPVAVLAGWYTEGV